MIAKRIIVKYWIRYDTLPILKYPFIIGIVKNISGVPCEKKKKEYFWGILCTLSVQGSYYSLINDGSKVKG